MYKAGKERGMTKKRSISCLKVVFGTNSFFGWCSVRSNKSDASPRTGEDDNSERVKWLKSRA